MNKFPRFLGKISAKHMPKNGLFLVVNLKKSPDPHSGLINGECARPYSHWNYWL